MTFEPPFVFRVHRTCRACGVHVEIILLNGATIPRDPYFACSRHRDPVPVFPKLLNALDARARQHALDDQLAMETA